MNLLPFSIAILILSLFSCENDLSTIEKVTFNPKSPDETIYDFKMVYSDSGYARVELKATYAETINTPEKIKYTLKIKYTRKQSLQCKNKIQHKNI